MFGNTEEKVAHVFTYLQTVSDTNREHMYMIGRLRVQIPPDLIFTINNFKVRRRINIYAKKTVRRVMGNVQMMIERPLLRFSRMRIEPWIL